MATTNIPLIILAGEAGSGKDTVGNWIAANYNGICLGQADPMKRFVRDVFGFTEDQLWGPSELRNAPDLTLLDRFNGFSERFDDLAEVWVDDLLPDLDEDEFGASMDQLRTWFEGIQLAISEGPVSPRMVLQTLGTQWGREQNRHMWNQYAIECALSLVQGGYRYTRTEGLVEAPDFDGYDYGVITDGRFRNEVLGVRSIGGVSYLIDRVTDRSAVEAAGIKNHASERLNTIPRHFYTRVVKNDGTLPQLFYKMHFAMCAAFDDIRGAMGTIPETEVSD